MKKELISKDNLDAFICKDDGKLYLGKDRLLTPGAKDELVRRHVTIVYDEPPASATQAQQEGCRCGCGSATYYVGPEQGMQPKSLEQLARTVAAMLSREYGVTDPEQLKSLTIEALKTIKNNI